MTNHALYASVQDWRPQDVSDASERSKSVVTIVTERENDWETFGDLESVVYSKIYSFRFITILGCTSL